MKIFFLDSGLLKIDFSMKVLVSFGLRPIESGFFGESLFLVSGLVKIDFSMKVFVFLVSGL